MELKELPEIRGCQNDRIFEGFSDFQNKIEFMNCGFLDFWISSFFWISFHIFGTRRATGDPLVSKRPKFLGLYRFTTEIIFFGFLDFWISGFLHFFGFLAISSEIKELPEIRRCQNDHDLFVIVYLVFFCICVCVSVFVFVFVFVFLSS